MNLNMKQMSGRVLAALLCLLVLIGCVGCASAETFSFLPTREYNGTVYEARPETSLEAVLLIGYDHYDRGDMTVEQTGYSNGGQSDFLLLVLIDHENSQIRRLQIDRDTITDVKLLGPLGGYFGTRKLQICLSHAYGATQEANNANAVWAVENLLGIADENDGAGIAWYMTMDISGINKLNELLGGVTVPIEDDFSAYDKSMVQGTTMTLTGRQAEYYTRMRYHIGEQSNASRMVRQRHYMNAAAALLKEKLNENINFTRELLNGLGIIYDSSATLADGFGFTTTDYQGTPVTDTPSHYLMTDESLDAIVALLANAINYDLQPIETLPGQHSVGSDGFIRYDLVEGAALEWTMNAFYRPIN